MKSTLVLPIAWEESTMDIRDTGVSKLKSCSVRSVVVREVNPFRSSCWSPEKSAHFNCPCNFSNFSRFSALSSGKWARSLFSSLNAIRYSNSKSDSIKATATQKMVASRLVGLLIWDGSVRLSFREDELLVLDERPCCVHAWILSSVALRGGSEHLSTSPNFLGTEKLLWCRLRSAVAVLPLAGFTFSCPVLFRFAVSLVLDVKSGEDELNTKHRAYIAMCAFTAWKLYVRCKSGIYQNVNKYLNRKSKTSNCLMPPAFFIPEVPTDMTEVRFLWCCSKP